MRIIKIDQNNQVNGDGLRCVLWCSGCLWNCPECHNPETHNPETGHYFSEQDWNIIKSQLEKNEIAGITLTGGDPFFPQNRQDMLLLCQKIKTEFPNKNIWCYTGYKFEMIKDEPIMEYIDVLIDGTYQKELNPGLGKVMWRGSTNQRVINVKQTLATGEICILYE